MIKLINIIIDFLFKPRCPECDSYMDSNFIDMTFDKSVYECRGCKKEWI